MSRGLNPELGVAMLRVVLGVTFVAHGAPTIFGGIDETVSYLTAAGSPAPPAAAWIAGTLELVGGLALLVGLLVRPVALVLVAYAFLAIIAVHAGNGWYVVGPRAADGVEFHVLLAAGLLALVFAGPGLAALDTRSEG